MGTTVAPALVATAAVSSVLRSSSTINWSTRGSLRISSLRITLISGPTVAASSRQGMHTDTVRPALAAMTSSLAQSSNSNRRTDFIAQPSSSLRQRALD